MPRGGILASLQNVESEETPEENQLAEVEEEESVEVEEPESDAQEDPPADDSPDLGDRLRQFGVNEDIPDEIDETTAALVESVLSKADERVRGFQSSITKAAQEVAQERQALGAKAQAYDALQQDPQFQRFMKLYAAGELPDEEEFDVSKLPEDPVERWDALTARSKPVTKLEKRLETLELNQRRESARSVWNRFVAEHPDADEMQNAIGENMAQGMSLPAAYKAAKADSFDPEAERQKIMAEVQASLKAKKKTSAVATKSGKSSEMEVSPEELEKMTRRQRLFHYMEKAVDSTVGQGT